MLGEIRFLSVVIVKELNKTWFGHFLDGQFFQGTHMHNFHACSKFINCYGIWEGKFWQIHLIQLMLNDKATWVLMERP